MPKPATIEKRNNSKKLLRMGADLLDDEKFLDAVDEIEDSDEAAGRARQDAAGYFRGKGVKIPPGLEILEVERESPFYFKFTGFGVSVVLAW